MGGEKTTVDSFDVDQKQWYRVGGIAALVLGVAYIIIIFLYAQVGAPPTGGGDAWFHYLHGKTTIWWAILGLSVLTDFLRARRVCSLPSAERGQQKRDAASDRIHGAVYRLGFGRYLVPLRLNARSLRQLLQSHGCRPADSLRRGCQLCVRSAGLPSGNRVCNRNPLVRDFGDRFRHAKGSV